MASLADLQFPEPRNRVRGSWIPIWLEPVVGSGERLTVGIAAIADGASTVIPVPGLPRLKCLFDAEVDGVLSTVEITLKAIEEAIRMHGAGALVNPPPVFSGFAYGTARVAVGNSLEEIVHTALRTATVLSVGRPADVKLVSATSEVLSPLLDGGREPRIIRLVRDFVTKREPKFKDAFHRPFTVPRADVPTRRSERGRTTIGFVGERTVSNFAVISGSRPGSSVRPVQSGLWTLKVFRDAPHLFPERHAFSMIVQRPPKDDPQISDDQSRAVDDVIDELASQAKLEDIPLVTMTSVPEIGEHLLMQEAA